MLVSFFDSLHQQLKFLKNRTFCSIILSSITVLLICYSAYTNKLFVIMDGLDFRVLKSSATDPHLVLKEAGITIDEDDSVIMPASPVSGAAEVVIDRSHDVYIEAGGQSLYYKASDDTVFSALRNSGIELGALDEVTPPVETPITDDMNIKVVRVGLVTETFTEEIPYKTIKNPSIYINKGTEVVKKEGSPGVKTSVYEISLRNGVEVGRRLVSEKVVAEPEDRVIEYGTGGTITTKDGKVLKFKRVISGQATAYTTEGYSDKTNALGRIARKGTIAVDPRVIPLRSRVYVTSTDGKSWIYGEAIAEDTGGAIKGNIIDLFFDTRAECFNFGRRRCKIYILE